MFFCHLTRKPQKMYNFSMYHLKETTAAEIVIKKSRFIGLLIPVSDINDVSGILSYVRKQYPNATHYCTAMIIGNVHRSNDDGEPSGTAGLPMLECLRHKDIDNVLAVVIRYFGGTLLGTGGLVRAYQQAVNAAFENAVLTLPVLMKTYSVSFPYEFTSKMENYLQNNALIIDRSYGQEATIIFQCENDLTDDIRQLTSGICEPIFISEEIAEKPIEQ